MRNVIVVFAIVLFSITASAQQQNTTADFHRACNAPDGSFLDGFTTGYVSGIYAALPDVNVSATTPRGDVRDAVCQYVNLHPELWDESYSWGVTKALRALYSVTRKP